MHVLGDAAVIVLLAVAVVHVYWAVGGKAGIDAAIPTDPSAGGNGRKALSPGALMTALVAGALVAAAGLVAARIGLFALPLPAWLIQAGCAVLALTFLARAIGEFRYVGFFKRVRGTRFARMDAVLYSPLCLLLAIAIGMNCL